MDAFEEIAAQLLEEEGFWVRKSVKVNLTQKEKRATGKHMIPRPEIDLAAFKFNKNELILIEVKSYLDSPGVRIGHLKLQHAIAAGSYKLLTTSKYRNIIESRLAKEWIEIGLINKKTNIKYGLIAGNVYQNKEDDIKALFDSKGWFFWGPKEVKKRITQLEKKAHENNLVTITAKILLRD
jgi:hypothetical protein